MSLIALVGREQHWPVSSFRARLFGSAEFPHMGGQGNSRH